MMATTGSMSHPVTNQEGTIASIFASLDDSQHTVLPPRYATLKQDLWRDSFVQSWKEVLTELNIATKVVIEQGTKVNEFLAVWLVMGHSMNADHSSRPLQRY